METLGGNGDLTVLGMLLVLASGSAVAARRVSSGAASPPAPRPSAEETVPGVIAAHAESPGPGKAATTEGAGPAPDPASYVAPTSRQFVRIADRATEHVGERMLLYGEVTQFDAATGPGTLLAQSVASRENPRADDGTFAREVMFLGRPEQLADIDEGDAFRALVTVVGTRTYATGDAREVTVACVTIDAITVYWWSRALDGPPEGEHGRASPTLRRVLGHDGRAVLPADAAHVARADPPPPDAVPPTSDRSTAVAGVDVAAFGLGDKDIADQEVLDLDLPEALLPGDAAVDHPVVLAEMLEGEAGRAIAPSRPRVLESKRLITMAAVSVLALSVSTLILAVAVAALLLRDGRG